MFRTITASTFAFIMSMGAAHAVSWDTNDDGKVDAKEFATGNISDNTFTRFDDNGDGTITPNEVGLDSPDDAFRRADDNGDGYLTKEELTLGTFYSYDGNVDGILDAEEFERYQYEQEVRSKPFGGPGKKLK